MNEDRPKAAPADLGEEVEDDSSGGDGHHDVVPAFGLTDPRVALSSMAMSKDALRLYLVVAAFADGRTRVARPGQDRLARFLGWDRRRVHRALTELGAVGFIQPAGTHSLGRGRWVKRYRVAPYRDDAREGDASTRDDAREGDASTSGDRGHDAHVSGDTMRTFPPDDAHVVRAPSYQSSSYQSSSEGAAASERRRGAVDSAEIRELDSLAVSLNLQAASYDELRTIREQRDQAKAAG